MELLVLQTASAAWLANTVHWRATLDVGIVQVANTRMLQV